MSDKKLVKYKLIDKEGFIAEEPRYNLEIFNGFRKEGDIFEGEIVIDGSLDVGYESGVIESEELRDFFELVPEDKNITEDLDGSILWDGVSELKVGMKVKFFKEELSTVVLIKDSQVVISHKDGSLSLTKLSNLRAAKPTHKEATLTKVVKAWKIQGLDFAFDTEDSLCNCSLKRVFNVIYGVIEEENNNAIKQL